MPFVSMMWREFTLVQVLELLLRIVTASVCGILVGAERSRRFKDAGLRTHCVVACASAVLMIVSKYGFADLSVAGGFFAGTNGADPSRIASQVVAGVSFLGAGIIYRDRKLTTRGLTTAAGIWATAGIGMAIGAGMYPVGLFATGFMLAVQAFTHHYTVGGDRYKSEELEIVTEDNMENFELLRTQLEQWGVVIVESSTTRTGDKLIRYDLTVRSEGGLSQEKLTRFAAEHVFIRVMRVGGSGGE